MREPNGKLNRDLPETMSQENPQGGEQQNKTSEPGREKALISSPPTKPDPLTKVLYTGETAGVRAGPRDGSGRSMRRHRREPASPAGHRDTEDQGFLAWRYSGFLDRSMALSGFSKRCAIQNEL